MVESYSQTAPSPKFGCLNVHASLLPKYRGAVLIHWSVIKGETQTGVCTMQMDEGMDTGDVLLSQATPISVETTTGDLWHQLSHMGADLMVQTLENLENIVPKKQDHDLATYAPLLKKEDGLIDFSHSLKIFIIWFEVLTLGLVLGVISERND